MILSLPPCSLKYAAFTRCGLLASKWYFRALVFHSPRFVVPARELTRFRGLHGDADAEADAQRLAEGRAEPVALGPRQRRRRIDAQEDVVEAVMAAEDDLKLVDARERPHELLDTPRIDDD